MEKFESVLGSKPELDEASVASYNVACCYSKLNQVFPIRILSLRFICATVSTFPLVLAFKGLAILPRF